MRRVEQNSVFSDPDALRYCVTDLNAPAPHPKLFVSYSWTDHAHIEWVLQLATDLRGLGVETIIDRWHLREGQDAHSFMETMVRSGEVNKAILVCDKKYVERANTRTGGVGAESQIVTSNIFADVEQTKFVGVIRESDDLGQPLLPNFLTSRVYIDFRDDEAYSERLQQLVRWAYDKPLYREPEIGPRPAFLDEQVDFEPIRVRSIAGLGHNSNALRGFLGFLGEAARQKSDFTVQMTEDEPNDETVYRSILSLGSIISQFLNELTIVVEARDLDAVEVDALSDYFSEIYKNYRKGPTSWSADVTKFYGQFVVTAVIGRFLKFRRFSSAKRLLTIGILKSSFESVTAESASLGTLNEYLRSLEGRNQRLGLNRLSIQSDLIRELCGIVKIEFVEYMQADLVIYVHESTKEGRWWPDSLLYATESSGSFPIFARAVEPSLRDDLLDLMGVAGKESLQVLINKLASGEIEPVRWQSPFSTVDIRRLANLDKVMTSYC